MGVVRKAVMVAVLILLQGLPATGNAGSVYNPISDTDWSQMTKDLGFGGLCKCKNNIVGVKFHFWEPIATVEVIRKPWSMPSFGVKGSNKSKQHGAVHEQGSGNTKIFYQAHYVKYPVLAVFQLGSLLLCHTLGGIDIGWMSEIDPTWNDEELALLVDFQALLTANPIAQLACLPDALQTSGAAAVGGQIGVKLPGGPTADKATGQVQNAAGQAKNSGGKTGGTGTSFTTKVMSVPLSNWLFWCAGGWGPLIPTSGNQNLIPDNAEAGGLMVARTLYTLQKYAELWGTDAEWMFGNFNANGNTEYCSPYPLPHQFLIKDKYRVNPAKPVAAHAMPIGTMSPLWEYGEGAETEGYIYVVWRYKKCCISIL